MKICKSCQSYDKNSLVLLVDYYHLLYFPQIHKEISVLLLRTLVTFIIGLTYGEVITNKCNHVRLI